MNMVVLYFLTQLLTGVAGFYLPLTQKYSFAQDQRNTDRTDGLNLL